MNLAVSGAGMGTKPNSVGGEVGVYAPRCRSFSRGTPSMWECESRKTASGMTSSRPAGSCSSGPSGDARSTAGSGVGWMGGSRAGGRRVCAPWELGGRAGPPSRGRGGGVAGRGDRGGLSAHRGPAAHRSRHCRASPTGYHAGTQGCGGGEGTCQSGVGCIAASAWPPVLHLSPRPQ